MIAKTAQELYVTHSYHQLLDMLHEHFCPSGPDGTCFVCEELTKAIDWHSKAMNEAYDLEIGN